MKPAIIALWITILLAFGAESSPVLAADAQGTPQSQAPSTDPKGCAIKGNISRAGEHIYHVPGGRNYDRTKIDPDQGERWFCSEQEAQAAGWRPARR